jgi:hypothetical protein
VVDATEGNILSAWYYSNRALEEKHHVVFANRYMVISGTTMVECKTSSREYVPKIHRSIGLIVFESERLQSTDSCRSILLISPSASVIANS